MPEIAIILLDDFEIAEDEIEARLTNIIETQSIDDDADQGLFLAWLIDLDNSRREQSLRCKTPHAAGQIRYNHLLDVIALARQIASMSSSDIRSLFCYTYCSCQDVRKSEVLYLCAMRYSKLGGQLGDLFRGLRRPISMCVLL